MSRENTRQKKAPNSTVAQKISSTKLHFSPKPKNHSSQNRFQYSNELIHPYLNQIQKKRLANNKRHQRYTRMHLKKNDENQSQKKKRQALRLKIVSHRKIILELYSVMIRASKISNVKAKDIQNLVKLKKNYRTTYSYSNVKKFRSWSRSERKKKEKQKKRKKDDEIEVEDKSKENEVDPVHEEQESIQDEIEVVECKEKGVILTEKKIDVVIDLNEARNRINRRKETNQKIHYVLDIDATLIACGVLTISQYNLLSPEMKLLWQKISYLDETEHLQEEYIFIRPHLKEFARRLITSNCHVSIYSASCPGRVMSICKKVLNSFPQFTKVFDRSHCSVDNLNYYYKVIERVYNSDNIFTLVIDDKPHIWHHYHHNYRNDLRGENYIYGIPPFGFSNDDLSNFFVSKQTIEQFYREMMNKSKDVELLKLSKIL